MLGAHLPKHFWRRERDGVSAWGEGYDKGDEAEIELGRRLQKSLVLLVLVLVGRNRDLHVG